MEEIQIKSKKKPWALYGMPQGEAPLFSGNDLVQLIWPMLLEQILMVMMGMVDTFMVSGVSEAAVSSVSLVDSLNVLFIQILSALATGGAVVSSQYLGRKDMREAKKCAAQIFSVMLICTVSLMLLAFLFSRPILRLVFGKIEEDVMAFSRTYFLITAISYPFIGIYSAGAALFRSQGNSKISMNASLVMNAVNIGGNALLIYGLRMGVLGAALATLAGRVVAAVWVFLQQQKKDNMFRMDAWSDLIPDGNHINPILAIGIPSGLENGMFQIGKLCVTSLISTLGTAAIAANAVANTVGTMSNIPGNTISLAMIPVIGQCLGAGKKKQARVYTTILAGVAFVGLGTASLILYFSIPGIAGCFHLSAEATQMCVRVIHCFCIFSIFFWVFSFTLPNALRSGGDAKFTMFVSVISMWVCRIVLSYFFVLKLHMGLLGPWLGMCIDWIVRGICFIIRFRSDKWMEHDVI